MNEIRDDLDVGIDLAASNVNPVMVAIFGRLFRRINTVERKTKLALIGEREPDEKSIREKTDAILAEMKDGAKR